MCLSIHNKQKDFGAKGLYNEGTREVRECSGVFITFINRTFIAFGFAQFCYGNMCTGLIAGVVHILFSISITDTAKHQFELKHFFIR